MWRPILIFICIVLVIGICIHNYILLNQFDATTATYKSIIHDSLIKAIHAGDMLDPFGALLLVRECQAQINSVTRLGGGSEAVFTCTGIDVENILNELGHQEQRILASHGMMKNHPHPLAEQIVSQDMG
jgi:hypothetical protein